MKIVSVVLALLGTPLAQAAFAIESVHASGASLAFTPANDAGSARSIALGSTYVGIAEGVAALPWNPAGLASIKVPEVALDHNGTLIGAFRETVSGALPLKRAGSLGFSVNFGDNGAFEGRDASGNLEGDYTTRAFGVAAGWGLPLTSALALGAVFKINRLELAEVAYHAMAADVGALWTPTKTLSVGASYNNLGLDIAGAHLEQGLSPGISSYFSKGKDMQWLTAVSADALTHGNSTLRLGLENKLYRVLALRLGYRLNLPHDDSVTGLAGWTFGGGVEMESIAFDYAFIPMAELGSTHRLSLTYAFAGPQ